MYITSLKQFLLICTSAYVCVGVCVMKSIHVFKSVTDSGQFYAILFIFFYEKESLPKFPFSYQPFPLFILSLFSFLSVSSFFIYDQTLCCRTMNKLILTAFIVKCVHTYINPTWHTPGRVYQLSLTSLSSGRVELSCGPVRGQKRSWQK